jgi:hypothetical protein
MDFCPEERKMPYKDPEKRRAYQRDYKRRQRALKKLSNPVRQTQSNPKEVYKTSGQTGKRKAYICLKIPSHRMPRIIQFKNGLFVTDQPEDQEIIESDPLYGKEIFSWVLKP